MTDEQLTAIYNEANDITGKRLPITTARIFAAMRAAILVERKAWMVAVTDEPELPGEMPDEMWSVLRTDRDAATEALRIIVRQTKGGILTRGMRSNAKVSGVPTQD
jgi:hypothetical protein